MDMAGLTAQLTTPGMALAVAVAGAAGLVRGFAGFGSGLMMVPVLALAFGPKAAVPIVVMLEVAVSAHLLPKARREVEWRFVGLLAAGAFVTMPLGVWLLTRMDPAPMTRLIGITVMAAVVLLGSGWAYRGPRPRWLTVAVGAVSGVFMSATTLGIPPVLVYMMAAGGRSATVRANLIAYFPLTMVFALAVQAFAGVVDAAAVTRAALMLAPFVAGSWLGARLFRPDREALYRRVVLALLFAVGLVGLLG